MPRSTPLYGQMKTLRWEGDFMYFMHFCHDISLLRVNIQHIQLPKVQRAKLSGPHFFQKFFPLNYSLILII